MQAVYTYIPEKMHAVTIHGVKVKVFHYKPDVAVGVPGG